MEEGSGMEREKVIGCEYVREGRKEGGKGKEEKRDVRKQKT